MEHKQSNTHPKEAMELHRGLEPGCDSPSISIRNSIAPQGKVPCNTRRIHRNPNKEGVARDVRDENKKPFSKETDDLSDAYTYCATKIWGKTVHLMSIYNYMGLELSPFNQLTENIAQHIDKHQKDMYVIGGDMNADIRFMESTSIELRTWGKAIEKLYSALKSRSFAEALENVPKEHQYTYIAPRNKKPYQIDYLFIRPKSAPIRGWTESPDIVFEKPRMSDHLPVFAKIHIWQPQCLCGNAEYLFHHFLYYTCG